MSRVDTPPQRPIRIAVVGDVHDQWSDDDGIALEHLQIDLVLLVGDFGNEAVPVVRSIAQLNRPKAVILGNHDAWYSATPWGRKKCPYDRCREDRVQQQLDLLGVTHVGYGQLDFPGLGLSVVGGRPFSWGGSDWTCADFYRQRYGITDFQASAARIQQAIDASSQDTVIFIGHCGPTGLGNAAEAPCGRDWKPLGGDFGDPDLRQAITYAQHQGKRVPLVTFGHMHHRLRHTQARERQRLTIDPHPTIYLNAASVPRVVKTGSEQRRNFSIVTLSNTHQVQHIALCWLNQKHRIVTEDVIYHLETAPALAELA